MEKIFFTGPNNKQFEITDENMSELYNNLIRDFPSYWKQGNCSGNIEIFIDEIMEKRLSIGFFEELGLCLTYEEFYDKLINDEIRRGSKVDLAVYDESKLDSVVDIYFELYTSRGLLMPPELAWKGIHYFIQTGNKSPELKWITPDMLPDSGNWA